MARQKRGKKNLEKQNNMIQIVQLPKTERTRNAQQLTRERSEMRRVFAAAESQISPLEGDGWNEKVELFVSPPCRA